MATLTPRERHKERLLCKAWTQFISPFSNSTARVNAAVALEVFDAGQPLPERRAATSAESHLIIGAGDYLYARQHRPEREHDEPAQRFARYLAEAAGYRACPRCLAAYTGTPLAHVCAAEGRA